MAKRTDFAQKLLDDLRMRKERMAMSQTSNHSKPMSSDKYRNMKQPSRGSRTPKPHETLLQIGQTTWDTHKSFDTGCNSSLWLEQSSNEIVPFGRARGSEHIADLSMALAFALQNGGKLLKMESSGNPMAGFLHHIGRSVDFGEMNGRGISDRSRPSNGRFPTLSHLHIKEISKGAQKLNQILKACSNGLNFDKYSINIGKELLKGAMDLEESLRMLVNLQEASEYMVSAPKKQQLRLLEGEEDDDDEMTIEVTRQNQLDRPRFSFDGPSRNSLEDVRGITKTSLLKQRLLALSYPAEAPHRNSEKQAPTASSNLVAHRPSASRGSDSSTAAAFSGYKKRSSSSHSEPEKGRIPNVIAKLMGLEELPANKEPKNGAQKDSSINQGTRAGKDPKKNLQVSNKKVEMMTMDSEKPDHQTPRQKVPRANKISATPHTNTVQQTDKILATRDATPQTVDLDGQPLWKDTKNMEIINLVSSSNMPTSKINRPQINMTYSHLSHEIRTDKQEKERRQDNPKPKEQKGTGRSETKDDLQRMTPQTHKHPEGADIKQERVGTKGSALQIEKKDTNDRILIASNQQKPPHDSGSQQTYMLRKSESQDTKLQAAEREQQNAKNKLQMKKTKASEKMLKNSLKPIHDVKKMQKKLSHMNHATAGSKSSTKAFDAMPSKGSIKSNHHEDLISDESSIYLKLELKKSPNESLEEPRSSPKDTETGAENVTVPTSPVVITKPMHGPSMHKVDNTQVHKSVKPRKIEEVVIRKNDSPRNMAKPLTQQISVSQKLKQGRHERIRWSMEAEASIGRSNEAKEASIEPLNSAQHLQKNADIISILENPMGEEHKMLRKPETIAPNATIQEISAEVSDSLQASTISLYENRALESSNIVSIQIKGPHEHSMVGVSNSLQQEQWKIPKSETQGSLTENENHLKQILIKSQLFLNAAEALFKLHIPFGILRASAQKCQDEDSKLVLDCGYEVMKRKGRRQEHTFHPCVNISIGSMKVKCLDDLVKELHEDLEKFKFYVGHGSNEYDTADCLHKMLKKDIQSRNPDVNCMWDFGWSEAMFAYVEKEEVIRDVEKHVLNGLIDDITRDFIHISIAI